IAEQPDARAVSMGDGARAADVWVVSEKQVSTATLLPATDKVRIRRIAGVLPSRAADNLFWLGRYLERTAASLQSSERIQRMLVAWGAISQTSRTAQGRIVAEALQSPERFGSALSL